MNRTRNASAFGGFAPETLRFLEDLSKHNNRDWFGAHRDRYERHVIEPALEFIDAMHLPLQRISRHFVALPKRIGGSLMRIHRDVRFSRDKRPYKTNVGIQFRHEAGKDVHAPGYYFHIGLDECFLGAGIWRPDGPALARIRECIVESPLAWQKASTGKPFTKLFTLSGESFKRVPRGMPADHPAVEDLKRKDFIAVMQFDPELLYEPTLVRFVAGAFAKATPLVNFLCASQELPF
jgi:uncharacterized protein (TIGR02453 family)